MKSAKSVVKSNLLSKNIVVLKVITAYFTPITLRLFLKDWKIVVVSNFNVSQHKKIPCLQDDEFALCQIKPKMMNLLTRKKAFLVIYAGPSAPKEQIFLGRR